MQQHYYCNPSTNTAKRSNLDDWHVDEIQFVILDILQSFENKFSSFGFQQIAGSVWLGITNIYTDLGIPNMKADFFKNINRHSNMQPIE